VTRAEKLAYTAGIIDGEGSILLRQKKTWYGPGISVASTTLELLHWLKHEYGGWIYDKKETRPNCSASYGWAIGAKASMELMPEIVGFIREKKKKARIMHFLTQYKKARETNDREEFVQSFYALTGDEVDGVIPFQSNTAA
jgi:hypothetical protein